MDNSGENQHWVPKFLLKNFADDDGRIFSFNIENLDVTKPPPKYAASDLGFYEFKTENETISYEAHLGKIEAAAAPVLRQVINSGAVAGLSDAQRVCVADFIGAQSFRTEALSQGFDRQLSRQQFGAVFARLWRSAFLITANLLSRKWAVIVIEHDDVFYLGDHPVVMKHTRNPSESTEVGIDIEGVELYFPLSPKCVLYMPCVSIFQEINYHYERAVETFRAIKLGKVNRHDNQQVLQDTEAYLRKATPLYSALNSGVSMIAIPDYVEHVNYQQCMWASSAIYSNRGDFTFARRVFRENPQYKSVPKVRMAEFGS